MKQILNLEVLRLPNLELLVANNLSFLFFSAILKAEAFLSQ